MASAVQFEAALREIVADERASAVTNLTSGGAGDYPAYREAIGFIRALDQLSEWCAEAGKTLDER
jgi:hypothetical protein